MKDRSKVKQVEDLTQLHRPVAVVLSETWLTDDVCDAELSIKDYIIYRSDRSERTRGGVCIYVHQTLVSNLVGKFDNHYVESLTVSIADINTIIVGVYRPPGTRHDLWKEALDSIDQDIIGLQDKSTKFSNIIALGDFNFRNIDWSNRYVDEISSLSKSEKSLSDFMDDHFLVQTLKEPTRQGNILDLVLVNDPYQISHSEVTINKLLSDHNTIVSHLSSPVVSERVEEPENGSIFVHDLSLIDFGRADSEDWFRYQFLLNKKSWSDVKGEVTDNTTMMNRMNTHIVETMNMTLPKKSCRKKGNKIPLGRRKLYREKSKISNRMKWTRSKRSLMELSVKLEAVEAKISEDIERSRFREESKVVEEIRTDPGRFFSYAKRFSKNRDMIGPLVKEDGSVTSDIKVMADILSAQYFSVFDPTREPADGVDPVVEDDLPSIETVIFTEEKIRKALCLMTAKPSPGPDGIPGPGLKRGGDIVVEALVEICNDSIETSKVAQDLRDALINPTWKGGDKGLAVNYRPIALTSHYSKIMEQVIRMELIDFMELHGLCDESQHGSKKGRSTVSQLLAQHEEVLRLMEDGGAADLIYLDFSKAFDRVSHPILLAKLRRMGVKGKLLEWIKAWLSDRRQAVKIAGALSDWTEVPSSVPQGSILGPLLFLIFIGDLGNNLPEESTTTVRKYVDDTKCLRGNKTREDVENFQSDLFLIYEWEAVNRLPFNGTKFQNIKITVDQEEKELSTSTLLFTPNYMDPIQELDVVKDLGVLIDSNGDFRSQRLKAQRKTMSKCSWILRTFKSRDPGLLKSLWQSLAQPHQDYASQLWTPVARTGEIAWQEKPLRQFTRRMKGLSHLNYWDRLSQMKMLSCERRAERYKIIYMWKILNGLVPNPGITVQTTAGSRSGLTALVPPLSGTKDSVRGLKERYFTCVGPRLFNSLPRILREDYSTLQTFKSHLDLYLEKIPDQPVLAGYATPNYSMNGRQSNSLIDWIRNRDDLKDYVPKTLSSSGRIEVYDESSGVTYIHRIVDQQVYDP